MKTVSLVNSVSRRAGGLFESVRRLHQELLGQAEAAASNGEQAIRVDVLGTIDEFTACDVQSWAPIQVHCFQTLGPRWFGYAPGLIDYLTRIGPEIVHVHGLWQYPSVAVRRWHEQCRRPYVVSPHGMLDRWALQNSSWKKRLAWMAYEQRHLRGASCLRALCDAEAKDIRRLGFSAPICVIPNGVDLPQLRAAVAAPKYKPTAFFSNQKVLLYLGRIHPKKGLRPLLEAWAKARSREPWVLIIAGWDQGRYAVQLKRMASDLGLPWSEMQETPQLDRSVVFTGPLFGRAKQDWLRRCDAFVLPSLSEGLPMAVLEAWAFAKPVLMSSHCNLAEGFRARAAILIEPTRRGIAEGLRELFATPEASLKAAGLRGRTLVERSFTWPRAAAELNSVYRWMLGSGPKPQCIINY